MKKLRLALCSSIFISIASSCTPGPAKLTEQFLADLKKEKYEDAKAITSPAVKQQITVVEQDKHALYNGQLWSYQNLETQLAEKSATVSYTVKLSDGSEIKQRALLSKSTDHWLVQSVANLKITYSPNAIKERTYPENGTQMLITPLDIDYITAEKLAQHSGQFIMLSGNICSFHNKGDELIMTMGADSSIPLLDVKLTGSAKAKAVSDHNRYLKMDYMVESPMGDTFTAIGVLSKSKGRFYIQINNPENIFTGPMLRIEKQ